MVPYMVPFFNGFEVSVVTGKICLCYGGRYYGEDLSSHCVLLEDDTLMGSKKAKTLASCGISR